MSGSATLTLRLHDPTATVAPRTWSRTVDGMSKTPNTHDHLNARRQLVQELAAIGITRLEQVVQGGPLWAAFLDTCDEEHPPSEASLEKWLSSEAPTTRPETAARLRTLVRTLA